jgi:peptide-methionine (S)-S-oxide reductase
MHDEERKGGEEREVAVFAGGCFWCLEPAVLEVRGVLSVESGYTGGTVRNPSYEAVCGGDTGHAEAVRIEFDPQQVSYRELLAVFFGIHDPTTLNRQGYDVGTQYRSAIFHVDETQRREALDVIARLESGEGNGGKPLFDDRIVTEVAPLGEWFPAEEYHQRYYERNPYQGYCSAVISPKLAKFRREFAALRKR